MLAPDKEEWDIPRRIEALLRREGAADVSKAACRAWAREFIRARFPQWSPECPLTAEEYRALGVAFMRRCADAGLAFPTFVFSRYDKKVTAPGEDAR